MKTFQAELGLKMMMLDSSTTKTQAHTNKDLHSLAHTHIAIQGCQMILFRMPKKIFEILLSHLKIIYAELKRQQPFKLESERETESVRAKEKERKRERERE